MAEQQVTTSRLKSFHKTKQKRVAQTTMKKKQFNLLELALAALPQRAEKSNGFEDEANRCARRRVKCLYE